jgi:hypothetical protein
MAARRSSAAEGGLEGAASSAGVCANATEAIRMQIHVIKRLIGHKTEEL